MARKKQHQKWEPWAHDPTITYSTSNGGVEVRVHDDYWYKQSSWCKLIGSSLDATIRQLVREVKRGVY